MFIRAAGSYSAEANGDLPPLKALARESTGESARRAGRFVQLALIGAGRCVGDRSLPRETATYFTSGRGDLEVTVDLMVQLARDGVAPAPFDFINSVGNSACFHVAKTFGIEGRSLFVTRRHAPLESALQLAALDMRRGDVATALVGSADMCTLPLAAHRERIGVDRTTPVGEGSHWFLLTADRGSEDVLGELLAVRSFVDDAELRRGLRELRLDPANTVLAGGTNLDKDGLRALQEAAGIRSTFDEASGAPWYDSRMGRTLHRFLAAPPAQRLLHVNTDPSGRFAVLVVEARSSAEPAPKPPLRGPHIAR